MALQPDDILTWLPDRAADCLVAYSGGMDSHVLLHAMAQLRDAGILTGKLEAIHVNHGLSPHAAEWADHCRAVCAQLQVPLRVVVVQVDKGRLGPEQAAREARYRVFIDALNETRGVILMAHHQDDQVETQLYRMLRGTGIRGLAGIHSRRTLGAGMLVRPFLGYTRGVLQAYAKSAGLDWIEDESNDDTKYDRNYLRSQVMPVLGERWPGYRETLQRLAGLASESQALHDEVAAADLAGVVDGVHRLAIPKLLALSPARQRNLLRFWLLDMETRHGMPAPDHYVVDRICTELVPAAVDAEPVIAWNKQGRHATIRRFNERIYLVLDQPQAPGEAVSWQLDTPLQLPGLGTLFVVETADDGFLAPPGGALEVRFRQGGETAKPAGRKTRSLKKILQDYRVPPWLRDTMPLFYRDDDLVAVGDLFVTDRWRVRQCDAGGKKVHQIRWYRADLHCGY